MNYATRLARKLIASTPSLAHVEPTDIRIGGRSPVVNRLSGGEQEVWDVICAIEQLGYFLSISFAMDDEWRQTIADTLRDMADEAGVADHREQSAGDRSQTTGQDKARLHIVQPTSSNGEPT